MRNLSCENEFYLHENEKLFPYQGLSTYPRFETEARGKTEKAYFRCLMFYPPFEQLRPEESRHHADFFVSVVIPYCLAPTWGIICHFVYIGFFKSKTYVASS